MTPFLARLGIERRVHQGSTRSVFQTGSTVLQWGCLDVLGSSTVLQRGGSP